MKKKFVFIQLKIQNGEYEYQSKTVHEIEGDSSDVKEFAENYPKEFYGGEVEKDGDVFYFSGGEVACKLYVFEEITKEEYDILNNFLTK
jgi:hypothetical protein